LLLVTSDVDLLRIILLQLEARQVSPRATVIISIQDEADDLLSDSQAVAAALDRLLELDYIDGPGHDTGDMWLFRKLTRRGIQFLKATRDPAAWETMKQLHGRTP
jgi:hypothetical protein